MSTHRQQTSLCRRRYYHFIVIIVVMIMIAITATITATTIVAAANAATRPIVFKPTRPLRAPSRLPATASLHFPNIGSKVTTELCARNRNCYVIGFTRAEQCRPGSGELALEPFSSGDATAAGLPGICAAPRVPSQWLDENRQLVDSLC